MSEIKLTDQRPRTTTIEMPEQFKAHTPLPKDPELQAFIQRLRERFKARMVEQRSGVDRRKP